MKTFMIVAYCSSLAAEEPFRLVQREIQERHWQVTVGAGAR